MTWKELKEGWGLEPLPKELQKEFVCCMCNHPTKSKLYTTIPLLYSTTKEYKQRLVQLVNHCFCKDHAIQYYKD